MEQYKQNPSLLKAAKQIFGDIVVDAFGLPGARFNHQKMNSGESHLDWDSEEIILVFSNGNKVHMTNSEWATFTCLQN